MGDFEKLEAWQKSRQLMLDVHAAFKTARSNTYTGIRSQALRAASSIPLNLAEGCSKRSRRELARYAETAYASAKELMCALILAHDLEIISTAVFTTLAAQTDHVAALCYGLSRPPKEP